MSAGSLDPRVIDYARKTVSGSAIGLIVTSLISLALLLPSLGFSAWLLLSGTAGKMAQPASFSKEAQIGVRIVWNVLIQVTNVVILLGAVRMRDLKSRGLSTGACVLALIPCLGPCLILGIPFGIWGLVALNDASVQLAFGRGHMRTTSTLGVLTLVVVAGCLAGDMPTLEDGDIIFHTSRSSQSEALRRAMDSPYTHMGVIFIEGDSPVVYEAVGPVKRTPFDEWVARGEGGHFVVKRLSEADRHLTAEAVARLKMAGEEYAGLPYDPYFEWSDNRIYCSELVWKMYESALGIQLGTLQTFGDFDLSDPLVDEKLRERFPDRVPTDEVVISPASMFESESLVTVYEH